MHENRKAAVRIKIYIWWWKRRNNKWRFSEQMTTTRFCDMMLSIRWIYEKFEYDTKRLELKRLNEFCMCVCVCFLLFFGALANSGNHIIIICVLRYMMCMCMFIVSWLSGPALAQSESTIFVLLERDTLTLIFLHGKSLL